MSLFDLTSIVCTGLVLAAIVLWLIQQLASKLDGVRRSKRVARMFEAQSLARAAGWIHPEEVQASVAVEEEEEEEEAVVEEEPVDGPESIIWDVQVLQAKQGGQLDSHYATCVLFVSEECGDEEIDRRNLAQKLHQRGAFRVKTQQNHGNGLTKAQKREKADKEAAKKAAKEAAKEAESYSIPVR